jgi:general secretion pathway protein J
VNAPAQKGFTLIEVLVALALMSLIATLLIESLRLAGHTWQKVTRAVANTEEIARAQGFLRERMSTMFPPAPARGMQAASQTLVGGGSTLEFSSESPGAVNGAITRYRLQLSSDRPAALEIAYRADASANVGMSGGGGWSHEVLVAGASSVSVDFWEDGRWGSQWNDPTHLPRLIRIDVGFEASDRRRWPPLYVETRVDTRASCVFDVVGRRCRVSQ